MTNSSDQSRLISFLTLTICFILISISLSWNAYNTYQYQLITERQLKLENILVEILPTFEQFQSTLSSTTTNEQWLTKIIHFIQQLTLTNNNNIVKSNKVRLVFLEMLIEVLDTCISILYVRMHCMYVRFLSRSCSFISNMHNKLNETIKAF